jgi:dipeptidyl aminopeptidase/acylaminoacyl peptidase
MTAASSLDLLRALLRSPTSLLADVSHDPAGAERLLVRGDATGTMQLSELVDGERFVLTDLPEPVGGAHYLPVGRQAVLEIDQGGNERYGLWLVDLAAATAEPVSQLAGLRPLTSDPRFGHHFAGASPDGRWIAYVSNRADGIDFDLWTVELATGEHRLIHAGGTWYHASSGFAPDGRTIAVLASGDRPLDSDLVLVEGGTGVALIPLAHPDEAALVGSPAWIDDGSFAVSSNVGGDFMTIVRHELATGATSPLQGDLADVDAEVVTSRDGSTLLVIENRDGANVMTLRDPATGTVRREVPTPEPGVVSSWAIESPILSADGSRVYFTLSTPRMAGEVFSFDATTGQTRRLTHGPAGVPAERLACAEAHRVESFDGESVPMFVFRPDSSEPRPAVVVLVHGGPEAQSMQLFNPVIQGLVLAGFGVVVPNVRGSTGYGKRYASLDDTTKRLDSVRDLAAVHGFLDTAGFDSSRAALWGGSYGGYMVLAGVAFQPELWSAGVDIVGISDLVTFLQNTSDYRRAHREHEYGSLDHDRAFLESASPMRRVQEIRAPLFVIHGRNDPRVPVTEAEQLVTNLRQRGIRCVLKIYEDEGHGLARLANRLDAYPQAVGFLREVLAG